MRAENSMSKDRWHASWPDALAEGLAIFLSSL